MAFVAVAEPPGTEEKLRMIRVQRRRHLVVWLVLGPLILIGFWLGLASRKTPLIEDFTPGSESAAETDP